MGLNGAQKSHHEGPQDPEKNRKDRVMNHQGHQEVPGKSGLVFLVSPIFLVRLVVLVAMSFFWGSSRKPGQPKMKRPDHFRARGVVLRRQSGLAVC